MRGSALGSAHDILHGPEDRFIYGESPVCRRALADSLHTVRVYTLQVGQTIVFCGLSGSSSNGDRRHKPIVCPTSDLADSTRMYKLKGQANRLSHAALRCCLCET